MANLFSEAWMKSYQELWNNEPEVSNALAKIGFRAKIAYGFIDDNDPKGILIVVNGPCVESGAYDGQTLDWDFRASEENWVKWCNNPLNLSTLGMEYSRGKLKCKAGNFANMIKDPRMALPFIKAFSIIGRVDV